MSELHHFSFFTLIRVTDLNPADAFLPGSQSGEVDLTEGLVGQMQVDPLRTDGELKRYCLVSLCHHYTRKLYVCTIKCVRKSGQILSDLTTKTNTFSKIDLNKTFYYYISISKQKDQRRGKTFLFLKQM